MSGGSLVGEWLNLLLAFVFFGGIFWLSLRSRRAKRRRGPVSDGPENETYRVYTEEFDRELAGREIDQQLLAASPDYRSGWFKLGKDRWRQEIHLADKLVEDHRSSFQSALGDTSSLRGSAVTFLIDQSGSMEGDAMRWAAVACRLAAEHLEPLGCQVEILGFSTAGWRGGFAYQQWVRKGRPKRPGRLCALLHIAYKSFGQSTLDRRDWEAMLNPNVLRENVDGEALQWAATRLLQASSPLKHLIVLSDGAPVDDATLMHNGLSYLVRHLRIVIDELQRDERIDLSAIGIRHVVSEYYDRSFAIEDLTQLPSDLAKWLHALSRSTESKTVA
jgi:cobaltochelatase CobT